MAKKPTTVKKTTTKASKAAKKTSPKVTELKRAPETENKINGMFLLPAPAIIDVDDVDTVIQEHEDSKREAYEVDITQGKSADDFTLSNEWSKRPKDQRFTSYPEYRKFILSLKQRTIERTVLGHELKAIPGQTALQIAGHPKPLQLTNYSYVQLCQMLGLPRAFLQHCGTELASRMWDHAIGRIKDGIAVANILTTDGEHDKLRAMLPQTYGHIWNADMLELLENEVFMGDKRWKIPGEYNWSTGYHNPNVNPTLDSTSLFASDRDTTGFLCQDSDPIECGITTRGKPDLFFPGILWQGTEVGLAEGAGSKVKLMFLRGVCFNRSLRGVDAIGEVNARHTKNGMETLRKRVLEMASQMRAQKGFTQFRDRIQAAKATPLKIDAVKFMTSQLLLSRPQATEVVRLVKIEEDKPIETLMDVSNGITALARKIHFQNKRMGLEAAAANVLDIAYQTAA